MKLGFAAAALFTAMIDIATEANAVTIQVDHGQTFQSFYGCGASWTDTSAWIVNGIRGNPANDPRSLSSQEKDEIFAALFSKSNGIGLDLLRQPMGTSDFRWSDYTYEDSQGSFSVSRDSSYIIPTILRSMQENPGLQVMALPWSAPAWAKDNNNLNGGSLLDYSNSNHASILSDYHDYFVEFVQAYAAEGIPIWALSVQNEPQHASNDYPTMTMSSTNHAKLIENVRSALDAAQLSHVRVVGYDHNWDTPGYIADALSQNTAARSAVSAIAFHCYGGNVDAQSSVKSQFPEIEIFFTECTEHGSGEPSFNGDFRWALRELVIGATRNWASTIMQWNMVLFDDGGPKKYGGCSNCRGLIDIKGSGYRKNPAFYALGHLSKFVTPGAHRIFSSQPEWNTKTLVMENPDGSSFVIVLNDGSPDRTFDVVDWMMGTCSVWVKSWSAVTLYRAAGSMTAQVWRTTDQESQTRLVHTEDVACVPNPGVTPAPATSPVVPPTPVAAPTASPVTPSPVAPPTASPVVVTSPTAAPVIVSPTPSPVTPPTASPVVPLTASPVVPLTASPIVPIASPTASPVEPPTDAPNTPAPCCTYDFNSCVGGGWCGESQANCLSCNGYWGTIDGTCMPFWAVCTNDVNPNCCGGATCQGNQWHKACVPPP